MPSQPADTPPPNISPASAVLLAVAVLAGTTLAGLIAAQAVTGIKVYVGAAGFFGGVMSIGGIGFIVQLAADRIRRNMEELEAKFTEQCENNVASAFVAGAAGGRHLTAVNDR